MINALTEEDLNSSLKLLTESSTTDNILTESLIANTLRKMNDFFSLEYDHKRALEIVDAYLEDYRLEELKAYIFNLYLLSEQAAPTGFIKSAYYFFSKNNRKTFHEYKTQINQVIIYAEKGIRKITKDNFKFSAYLAECVTKLNTSEQAADLMSGAQTITSNNELVTFYDSRIAPLIKYRMAGDFLSGLGHFFIEVIKVGIEILGWTFKIILSALISIIATIIIH